MAKVETLSVAITPETAETLRQAVQSGEYASAGDVVREALLDWTARRADRTETSEALGRLWDAGDASGPSADGTESFERLRVRLASVLDDHRRAG